MGLESFFSSDNDRLNRQLLFVAEVDKMTAVLRHTVLIDKSRRENDAEHSWHIALMCLLFEEYATQKVNVLRACAMCVIHDLIEIYAGDTFAFDEEANRDKEKREKMAADKLFAMLPVEQGEMLRSLWEEFDAMETPDSKYASCMDRLQPFLHNTLTDGHTWVEANAHRSDVEKRDSIIKEFMPEIYKWIEKNIKHAIDMGWINE
ncbi:MAG: HD domain-containing protein [Treponema sp.]|nr:HD domain-containing protein [Treponema sp.]